MNKNRYKIEILLLCKKTWKTAEQLHSLLKKQYPLLGLWTVYRNLTELIKEGKLHKITWILDKTIYEVVEKNNISWHLICQNSNKVIKVSLPDIKKLNLNLPKDFDVSRVEVLFYGKFKNCVSDCKWKIVVK